MLPRPFAYSRPDTLEEATEVLAEHPGARPLAGGQSLLNVLKLRTAQVDVLVDVSRLDELRAVHLAPGGEVELGAGVTYRELADHEGLRAALPIVGQIASRLVDVQVRNRGTLGGNCCYHDPSSNFPPVLVALGAVMRVAGPGGAQREVPADAFFTGHYRVALGRGELLRSVVVPALAPGTGVGYSSQLVAADSWATARAAAVVRSNGTIEDARVVLGCLGPRPARQRGMEDRLRGQAVDLDVAERAVQGELEDVQPVSDVHASAEYRVEMARVMARRAIGQALGQGGTR